MSAATASGWPLLINAAVLGPLRQSPGRTALSVAAIALGVALGLAIHLINRTAADEMALAARSLFGAADLTVQGPSTGFGEELYPAIARLPGIRVASPVVEVEARLAGRQDSLTLQGIDVFRASRLRSEPGLETPGGGLGLPDEEAVFLSPAAARHLGLGQGDPLEVQVGLETVTLKIAGLLPASVYRNRVGVMDIAAAQWRLARLGSLNRIDLRLEPGADQEKGRSGIQALLPPQARVSTPESETAQALRLSRAYRTNLTALALVALFTGAFLVFATQALAVVRRRRQLALLRALGVSPRQQFALVLGEGALVGIAGAALGVALGHGAAALGLQAFGGDLGAGYFSGIAPQLAAQPAQWLLFFVLGVGVAVMGTLVPALESARAAPAQALKAGDEERPLARVRRWWIGLALFAVAGLALWSPPLDGLPLPGYFAIACLLLGAVLLMPALVHALFRRLPPGGAAWYQVASGHLKGSAGQATVSIAAVLVSFSLMVAMAIMVTSFRGSLEAWLEKILPADLYLRAGQSGESAFLDAAAQRVIAATPGIARAEFGRSRDLLLADDRPALTLLARPIRDEDAQRVLWLEAKAGTLAGGLPSVWVSEAAADLYGIAPGERLELPLGDKPVAFSVRGIWRDYSRQSGALLLDRELYRQLTGDDRANTASLWLAPGTAPQAAAQALRQRLPSGIEIRLPAQLRAASLRIFDRTFAVTYLLEAVAVLIGLFGISASMSAQVLARRGEFGMLRHIGMTRRQIAAALGFEGAAMGTCGVAAGLAVGWVVSLVLIFVVNRQSFHWSMDLHLPWGLLAMLAAALIAAAGVTAAWSGRQAMGPDVVRAVKEDW